jgi:hypothetical protein
MFDFMPQTTALQEDLEDARVLREAVRYIEGHGWCQGKAVDGVGRVCVLGSIAIVAGARLPFGNIDEHLTYRHPVFNRVTQSVFRYGINAVFNDAPGRTKAEVISALTGCADWLEAGRPDDRRYSHV